MPDEKKTAPEPEPEGELTRRQFFVKVGLDRGRRNAQHQ